MNILYKRYFIIFYIRDYFDMDMKSMIIVIGYSTIKILYSINSVIFG